MEELARRNSGICSFAQLESAALAKKVLFYDECYLGDTGYGAFWDRLFDTLPPFENDVLHSASQSVYSTVPELEPVRNLVEGLITSAVLFTGKSGDDNHNYIDHYQDFFIKHWKAQCGTQEEIIIRKIQEFSDKLNGFIASLGDVEARYGYSAIAEMTVEELGNLRESTDEMLAALALFEPDDIDSAEWQQWSDMEEDLLSIQSYADDRCIDFEEATTNASRVSSSEEVDVVIDDGTLFTFYNVSVDLTGRSCAYLAPGVNYKVGDEVIVPFGWKNTETQGTVIGIKQCTASEAPYPPGKTKGIIRLADLGSKGIDTEAN